MSTVESNVPTSRPNPAKETFLAPEKIVEIIVTKTTAQRAIKTILRGNTTEPSAKRATNQMPKTVKAPKPTRNPLLSSIGKLVDILKIGIRKAIIPKKIGASLSRRLNSLWSVSFFSSITI